jgi:hypothetical protein
MRWAAVPMIVLATLAGWEASAQEPAPKGDAAGLRIVTGERSAVAGGRLGALGHTSAPLIDVTQPRPDTLLVVMTGAAAAAGLPCESSHAEVTFDLAQNFTVVTDRPPTRPIRMVVEAQLIGMFRGNRDGAGVAEVSMPADASVTAGGALVAHVGFPGRSHAGKDTVLISERTPAVEALVVPGEYCLGQKFAIRCSHPKRCFHKNVVMAAFGDLGKVPEWLNVLDTARDLPKNKDLGFRVAIRVEPAPLIAAPLVQPQQLPQPQPVPPPGK